MVLRKVNILLSSAEVKINLNHSIEPYESGSLLHFLSKNYFLLSFNLSTLVIPNRFNILFNIPIHLTLFTTLHTLLACIYSYFVNILFYSQTLLMFIYKIKCVFILFCILNGPLLLIHYFHFTILIIYNNISTHHFMKKISVGV